MVSLLKLQDKEDQNNGVWHPVTDIILADEIQKYLDADALEKVEEFHNNAIMVGYWKPGKHQRFRLVDFAPYFRIETTRNQDYVLLYKHKDNEFMISTFWWENPETLEKELRGGLKVDGKLELWFTEHTRSNIGYRQKLKETFHIVPWKGLRILAMQFWQYDRPEDILQKEDIPRKPQKKRGRPPKERTPEELEAIKNKPKRPRGRPRKNPLPVNNGDEIGSTGKQDCETSQVDGSETKNEPENN